VSDFEITESSEGEVAVLAPKGSLNTRTSPAFEEKLGAVLDAKSRLIVVDMKGVDYLSSSALRVLLMTTRRLKRVKGKLFLCGLREEVRKVFAISGFDRDFNIQAARGEAIALALAAELPPAPEEKSRKAEKKAPAPPPAAAAPSAPPAVAAPAPPTPVAAAVAPAARVAPEPAASRPPTPAPHPAALLALQLLSENEDRPPWSDWGAATLAAGWRERVLGILSPR
jgi:anti-sigma B factor antagonist